MADVSFSSAYFTYQTESPASLPSGVSVFAATTSDALEVLNLGQQTGWARAPRWFTVYGFDYQNNVWVKTISRAERADSIAWLLGENLGQAQETLRMCLDSGFQFIEYGYYFPSTGLFYPDHLIFGDTSPENGSSGDDSSEDGSSVVGLLDSRAPPPPQVEVADVETPSSTTDVDHPHIESVTNDYAGETDTQKERIEHDAKQAELKTKTKFEEVEKAAKEDYKKGKAKAKEEGRKAKSSAKQAGQELSDNKDNPVVIGNAVVWTAIAGALGIGAYKQHQAGALNWKVAGTWASVVGLFAAGDYYLSQYLFKNKYPKK